MMTLSKTPFEIVEVELIPDQIDPGKFYYSEKYHTASHICPCGCGGVFSIPIQDGEWIIIDLKPLTIEPSLSHRINCKAHYVIQKGNAILLKEGLPKSMWGVNHGFDHAQPGE